jgi:cytochrome c551/c552
MKKITACLAIGASMAMVSMHVQAQENAAAAATAGQLGCMMCHNAEVKVLGPAFKAVAEKYKDQADAADKLFAKVKNGGSGVWGRVPMPPHNQVPDDKIQLMVQWVLKGAPAR